MQELKAYRTSDGVIHTCAETAIRSELRILIGSPNNADEIVERIEKNASTVCKFLAQLSKVKPTVVVARQKKAANG